MTTLRHTLENLENLKGCLLDFEFNNIESFKATKAWCCVVQDLSTGKIYRFHPEKEGPHSYHVEYKDDLKEFLKGYDYFVGHNVYGAEDVILRNLFDVHIGSHQWIDTLVLSRLFRPTTPYVEQYKHLRSIKVDNRLGGHSLEAWGQRLGFHKIHFDKFDEYSDEMLEYCMRDVELNVKVLEKLLHEWKTYGFPIEPIEIEHEAHRMLCQQAVNGFTINKQRVRKLIDDTGKLIEQYTNELREVFPAEKVLDETYTPKKNKDGTLGAAQKKKLLRYSANGLSHKEVSDGVYELYSTREFNPNSPQQVGERLMSLGWNPQKFTATGQPSTAKDVLGDAIDLLSQKVPQVEVLRKYNIIVHRNGIAKEWLELAKDDGKVHGSMAHIGPWTHRSSHYTPNMGNIPKVSLDSKGKPIEGLDGNFGWDCRNCLVASQGKVLVGVDAAGIQLRALAHYMNDPEYTKEVISGDIHTTNMVAAGITKGYHGMSPRDVSKRFIYSWLLGAGDEKVGIIVGTDEEEYEALFERAKGDYKKNFWRKNPKFSNLLYWTADKLRTQGRTADQHTVATILKGYYTKKQFLDSLPSLKKLKEEVIPEAASKGYMESLDGRKIWVPSEHKAMGAYLQGFEAVVMKWAMFFYQNKLKSDGVPFKQVGYVHDEWIIETDPEHAERVLNVAKWSIPYTGEYLGSKCPLGSDGRIGESWGLIH